MTLILVVLNNLFLQCTTHTYSFYHYLYVHGYILTTTGLLLLFFQLQIVIQHNNAFVVNFIYRINSYSSLTL